MFNIPFLYTFKNQIKTLIYILISVLLLLFIVSNLVQINRESNLVIENNLFRETYQYSKDFEKVLERASTDAYNIVNQLILLRKTGQNITDTNNLTALLQSVRLQSYIKSVYIALENNILDTSKNNTLFLDNTQHFVLHPIVEGNKITYDKLKNHIEQSKWYVYNKRYEKECVSEPYNVAYPEGKITCVTISIPFMYNSNFQGVIAVNIPVTEFNTILEGAPVFGGKSKIKLYSNEGNLIGKQDEILEKQKKQAPNTLYIPTEQKDWIQTGRYNFMIKNNDFAIYVPVCIDKSYNYWQMEILLPRSYYNDIYTNKWLKISIIIIISSFILLIFHIMIKNLIAYILHPIKSLAEEAEGITNGDLSLAELKTTDPDMNKIYLALRYIIEFIQDKTQVVKAISQGDYTQRVKDTGDADQLGSSINKMIEGLIRAQDEELRRKNEDEKRNWATQGLTLFSDVLRQNTEDLNEYTYKIISNLVSYLNANQGTMFIYNNEDKENCYLEQLGSIAYDRRKFKTEKILLGEGLAGTCALEKNTIYIKNVPEDYIEITSGLGKGSPRNILVVPLKLENEILGVIELASFNYMEKHEIEFVEKVAESIAGAINNTRNNNRTTALLEISKKQAEELAEKEEIMRMNLEEMKATQEEALNREQLLLDELQEVKNELNKYKLQTS